MKPRSKDIVWQCWRAALQRLQERVHGYTWVTRSDHQLGRISFPVDMQPELRTWHLEWRDYLFEERERGLAAVDHHKARLRHAKRNYRRGKP